MLDFSLKWVLKSSLEEEEDRWLEYVGGQWGPTHLTTNKIEEAILFDSEAEAFKYARECGWSHNGDGLIPVKVKYIPAQVILIDTIE